MHLKEIGENIFLTSNKKKRRDFEIVERKGKGHPDTMADALAEEFSKTYANYTLSNFGAILHHNFDKVGLLGGESYVTFGEGYLIKPIRVLINGRASTCLGDKNIQAEKLLEEKARTFLARLFPNIDEVRDIEMHVNLSTASSPGRVRGKGHEEEVRAYMFRPRDIHDLKELVFLGANDTSIGCSYAPLSVCEKTVLSVERQLNSSHYKSRNPWIGSDIKVMATRVGRKLEITICIPQIATYVNNIEEYSENIERAREHILGIVQRMNDNLDVSLDINTKDDLESHNLYLTAIGSSIESGDEGLVGRGNRINGLITPCRPMAIEGACGKNPVYHVGKLYNIVAQRIAQKLHEQTSGPAEVYLVSQNGRHLQNPWKTIIALEKTNVNPNQIRRTVNDELAETSARTMSLLKGEISLF